MYEKWLKAFHLVAAEGGVGRAARSLNVGQPTVSAHLRTLEDYFRVELFYRRGRRLELTDAGRALFNITQGLYGHESEAVAFLRSVGRTEQGRLRLGAVGPYDVVELAHAFQRAFPAVELSVTVLAGRELTAACALSTSTSRFLQTRPIRRNFTRFSTTGTRCVSSSRPPTGWREHAP